MFLNPVPLVSGGVHIFDALGRTVGRSRNLRGLRDHYRKNPGDMVVKVTETEGAPAPYLVVFYWNHGSHDRREARVEFADWRVLLHFIAARRSWSVDRVTFDAPLYDRIAATEPERFAAFRRTGILITRHAYLKKGK